MDSLDISLPLNELDYSSLKAGMKVYLSGTLYTARDQAHKRIVEYLQSGKQLPFPLQGSAIFYAGPSPAKPGQICGAIGPTTSGRMDKYTPDLLSAGVKVLIGKGERSPAVTQLIRESQAVYMVAVGGAAAFLSQKVKSCTLVCWEDLGTEAIYKLEVADFPCYVSVV